MNGLLFGANASASFSERSKSQGRAADLIRLGGAVFDPSRRTVRIGGTDTALEPRLADVLAALIASEGPVSRSALLDAAWGAGEGSDEALTQAISKLRKALGDDARPYRVIETAPKLGYRLAVEPQTEASGPEAPPPVMKRAVRILLERRQFAGGFAAGVACCVLLFAVMTIFSPPLEIEREVVCGAGADPAACKAAVAMLED